VPQQYRQTPTDLTYLGLGPMLSYDPRALLALQVRLHIGGHQMLGGAIRLGGDVRAGVRRQDDDPA
jgi:hypothetical protein